MKKQAVQKLKLFAGGMLSRFQENKDLFIEISGNYQSGTVSYPFSLVFDGEEYVLTFQKETTKGEFSTLFSSLIDGANLYDVLTLTYADRTGRLMLRADNKNVTTISSNKLNSNNKWRKFNYIDMECFSNSNKL